MASMTAEPIGTVGRNTVNAEVGEAQRVFAESAAAGARELVESGQCKPYSIINFNPVEVGLQGELKRYKVPTPNDDRLPSDVLRLSIEWEGKDRRGHILTIRDPHKYGKMVGAKQDGGAGEVTAQREPKYLTPQAIAYSFMEHFTPIFTAKHGVVLPPAPKDARKIYGLLVFEGDIHTLQALLDEEDPEKRVIRVPICNMTTIGRTSIRSYRTVEYPLDEYLEKMFTGQRKFADATVARAQQKWSETETIADISDVDRTWFRWMINLGYARKPASGEKTWLNEYLVLSGTETKSASRLRKCQACRAVEPEENTPFCPKCNAPINTFTTFMAGLPVPDAWLHTLKGEEREIVQNELKLRKQGFGDDAAPVAVQAKEVAPAKPETAAAKKAREAREAKAAAGEEPTRDQFPETEKGSEQFHAAHKAFCEKASKVPGED